MLVTLRSPVTYKGSASSGWFAPPRGTHSGDRHRSVGSGKAGKGKAKKAAPKDPAKVDERTYTITPPEGMTIAEYMVSGGVSMDTDAAIDMEIDKVVRESISDGLIPRDITSVREQEKWVEQTFDDNLEEYMADAELSSNVPGRILHSILDDGRFKNQLETGTSGGMYDPSTRMRLEMDMFQRDAMNVDNQFPIYGHMYNHTYPNNTHWYGDVRVVFKDSVKSRATVTVGDTLNFSQSYGTPPAPSSIPNLGITSLAGVTDAMGIMRGPSQDYIGLDYIEAQIHGGLTIKDISHVVFPSGVDYGDLEVRLERQGIRYQYGG